MRVLAAPDKFRFSASASTIANAIANGCWAAGHECIEMPLSDGGEGLLEVFGGANRKHVVTGPLGDDVEAGWRLDGRAAIIEMAAASGLTLVGGADGNDAVRASTAGTGELLLQAVRSGARRVLVGLGGSASTDGGLGALDVIAHPSRLAGVEVVAACDVDTLFSDAAEVFAPQKGAGPGEVRLLTRRLHGLAQRFIDELGVDVRDMPGSGAAGGLGGGLAAFGAELVAGFDVVAEERGLDVAVADCEVVITGEGLLDEQSFSGKVVGGVAAWAAEQERPTIAIVGQCSVAGARLAREHGVAVVSLVERFGPDVAMATPRQCIERVTAEVLAELA